MHSVCGSEAIKLDILYLPRNIDFAQSVVRKRKKSFNLGECNYLFGEPFLADIAYMETGAINYHSDRLRRVDIIYLGDKKVKVC